MVKEGKKNKLNPFDFVQILHKSVKRQATEVDMGVIDLVNITSSQSTGSCRSPMQNSGRKQIQKEAFFKR